MDTRIVHDGAWGIQFCRFRHWSRPNEYEVWINQPRAKKTRTLRLGRFALRWQPAIGYSTPGRATDP